MISTSLLLVLPAGRYWQHRRTSGGPSQPWTPGWSQTAVPDGGPALTATPVRISCRTRPVCVIDAGASSAAMSVG
jgi:hypothetical protein